MALAVIWADLGRSSYAPEVSAADLPRPWIRSGADQGISFSSPAQICPDLGSDLGQIRAYPSVTLPRSAQMFPQICPDPHQHLPACAPQSAHICPDLWEAGRSLSERTMTRLYLPTSAHICVSCCGPRYGQICPNMWADMEGGYVPPPLFPGQM
eukprot:gene23369-biopygen16351